MLTTRLIASLITTSALLACVGCSDTRSDWGSNDRRAMDDSQWRNDSGHIDRDGRYYSSADRRDYDSRYNPDYDRNSGYDRDQANRNRYYDDRNNQGYSNTGSYRGRTSPNHDEYRSTADERDNRGYGDNQRPMRRNFDPNSTSAPTSDSGNYRPMTDARTDTTYWYDRPVTYAGTTSVTEADLPAPVQTSFQQYGKGNALADTKKMTHNGQTCYVTKTSMNGMNYKIITDENGNLLVMKRVDFATADGNQDNSADNAEPVRRGRGRSL